MLLIGVSHILQIFLASNNNSNQHYMYMYVFIGM